jgi:ribose-phosphate pyrophosphokinase
MSILVGDNDEFNFKLANYLGTDLVQVVNRTFPDGEICPKIKMSKSDFGGEPIILSMRKTLNENPNSYLMKFLLIGQALHAATEDNLEEIICIMPYLPYARQDKEFVNGDEFEPVSIQTLVSHLGISFSSIVTFNSHFQRKEDVLGRYAIPIHNLDGFNVFDSELKNTENLFILAPDKGMHSFAEELSKKYSCDFDFMEKKRNNNTGEVSFEKKDLKHIKGKNIVIPDDLVGTGDTLLKTVNYVKKFEPSGISLMFMHGAFSAGAYERLQKTGSKLMFANTIKNNNYSHDITPYLARYIDCNL